MDFIKDKTEAIRRDLGAQFSSTEFQIMKDGERVQVCNVYVIGSMGSGKSTLLNWLLDFGQGEIFHTARSPQGVTTRVQVETIDRYSSELGCTVRIRLHDTPGLNEVDVDNDTSHTNSVLQCLSSEGAVSCVLLCVNSWRLDNQAVTTIEYYSKLFRPLFLKGNVVLLRTNLADEDYYEMTTTKNVAGSLKEFKDLFRKDLIEKVGNTANISFVEAINSKLHGRKAKEYLAHFQGLDAGGTTAIGAALEQPEDDVHLHSYKVRARVLDYISKCGATDMTKHAFPLPPQLEIKRQMLLEKYLAIQDAEIKATEKYNEDHARLLRQMVKKQRIYGDLVMRVNQLQNQIEELRQPIIVDKTTACGDDWVKFSNEKVGLYSKHPFTIPKGKWRLHNCECEVGFSNSTDTQIIVKPYLFLFHLESRNGKSWYADVWLECDGAKVNQQQIANKEGTLSACIGSRVQAYEDLQEATNEVENIKTDLDKRHDVDKKLRRIILLLSKDLFTNKDLPEIIQALSAKDVDHLGEEEEPPFSLLPTKSSFSKSK